MRPFERFIAIDWTGAKGRRHKAIEVAVCEAGRNAPVRVAPPDTYWSREGVLEFVQAQTNTRTLIGFDFSFAPPFLDQGRYLPDMPHMDGPEFWSFADKKAQDDDLGASGLIETLLRPHFYFGKASGQHRSFKRWRKCEERVRQQGIGTPASIFICIGPSQVGRGSFAGMRLLHRAHASGLPVWPFDPVPPQGPLLVEIYPRAFLRLAGARGTKLRTGTELDAALAALGSAPTGLNGALADHLTDALISSAGLRHVAQDPALWSPEGLTPEVARTEGWIFGVS